MATRKEAAPPQGPSAIEEEKPKEELDQKDMSRLCRQHCTGVPGSYGIDDRKPTVVCTTENFDDGSGEASTVGRCSNIEQQADHFKCAS